MDSALQDELVIFHNIEKEASKIDYRLLHTTENLKRLTRAKDKLAAKLLKYQTTSSHLDDQLKSALLTNKSVKENLKGKRQSRQTLELLVGNLERQLHLEEIDIRNKLQGFEQTKQKYDDMWKKYEAVYKKMPHMVKKGQAEEDLNKIEAEANKIYAEAEEIKAETESLEGQTAMHWRNAALLLAKNHYIMNMQCKYDQFVQSRDSIRDEIQILEIEIEKAQILSEREENQEKKLIGKLKNMMSTLNSSSQEFKSIQISDVQSQQDSEIGLDASDTEQNDFESLFELEKEFEMADFETSSPKISRKLIEDESTRYSTAMKRKASSPLSSIPSSPVKPNPSAASQPAPSNVIKPVENMHLQNESAPADDHVVSDAEIESAHVECTAVGSAEEEPVVVETTALNDEQMAPVSIQEKVYVEPPVIIEQENIPETEKEPENIFSSQITEVPIDLQDDQSIAVGNLIQTTSEDYVDVPMLAPANEENEVHSQGTESTACSSIMNLLDDDKRKEYMRCLMSSPTMMMQDMNMERQIGGVPSSPASSNATSSDNGYLQKFLSELNNGPNCAVGNFEAMSGQEQLVTTQNALDSDTQSNASAPSNIPGFGGFNNGGGYFGIPSAPPCGEGFFESAFGSSTSTPQQKSNDFAFNFGGQTQGSSSSFMNFF